jgi:thiamine biosynthesis protein ThiS
MKENTILIHINDQAFEFESGSNLSQAVAEFKVNSTFACTVNGEFVGKDYYQHHLLSQGDNIDVLLPIVGG